jgi:inward rectifier potassium channel
LRAASIAKASTQAATDTTAARIPGKAAGHSLRPSRDRNSRPRPRLLERPLSSGDGRPLAGIFRQCGGAVRHAERGIAFLYWLGHEPIANAEGNGPLAYFYFSIETLATVGYGDMHPQSDYGHLIATVEIFTGMSFLAVMTGLIFARFSRPRARFVFANHAVVGRRDGRQTLMIRTANARHNAISRASARLWLIRAERSREGDELRRFYELALDRNEHPMFVLSWTLFHVIDKDSPLYGVTATDLEAGDALLVLNVGGLDDSSAQQLYARHIYSWRDIRWGYRYRDIASTSPQGQFMLDYTKFHDVVAEEA